MTTAPASFTLRPVAPEDTATLAQIHVRGWQDSYGGLVSQDYLDSLSVEKRAADWQEWLKNPDMNALLACSENGIPAGFASFGRLRTPPPGSSPIRPPYSSEIYALYILPEFWRQGLGRKLMNAAAAVLKEKKHKSLCLWVLEKNERANAFYRALGGEKCGKKEVEIGRDKVREACYGWRDTAKLLATEGLES